jgi:molybdate transport system ATP-binding protein
MSWLSFACRRRFPSGFLLDVALEMPRRFTALFGPSGSGKTSILALVAGAIRPDAGVIRLTDRVLVDTAAGVWLPPERRRVGVVFQDALLFPHLTVQGNLRYGMRRPRNIAFSRVVEVLEIGPLLGRDPQNLSGGERQRVALGRALLSGPEVLLMDEPLAALDAPLKLKILEYLQRVAAEWDIPVLYVTHSQAEVRRAAEWVVVIQRGEFVAAGPPEEALGQPEPLTWNDTAGPANLVKLQALELDAGHCTARIGTERLFLPGGPPPGSGPWYVQFAPKDVILSRQDVAGLSVRNHLRGRVCKILAVAQTRFVAVDVGQVVWAEVTAEAAAELDLQTGSEVTCLIKAHSLRLIG